MRIKHKLKTVLNVKKPDSGELIPHWCSYMPLVGYLAASHSNLVSLVRRKQEYVDRSRMIINQCKQTIDKTKRTIKQRQLKMKIIKTVSFIA